MILGAMKLKLLNLAENIFTKILFISLLSFDGCVMDLALSEVVVQNRTDKKISIQLMSRDSLFVAFDLDSGEYGDFSPCDSYCGWFQFFEKNDSAVVVILYPEADSSFVIKTDILDSIKKARHQKKSFDIIIE